MATLGHHLRLQQRGISGVACWFDRAGKGAHARSESMTGMGYIAANGGGTHFMCVFDRCIYPGICMNIVKQLVALLADAPKRDRLTGAR